MFKIAFVEDNPSEVLLTKIVCEDLNFKNDEQIVFFEDESGLFNYLENFENDLDIIFLDVNIGNTSGLDVLRELRKKKIQIPIFMYSNSNNYNDIQDSKKLDAEAYIQKPYDYDGMKKLLYTLQTNLNEKNIKNLQKQSFNLLLQ